MPAVDETRIMAPSFRARMAGMAARHRWKMACTCTSNAACHVSGARSNNPPLTGPPGACTSTSIRPSRASVSATQRVLSAGCAQSATITSHRRPRPTTASRDARALSSRCRPTMATSAPSLARATAVAAPMPRVPPVTNAIFPDSFMRGGESSQLDGGHGLLRDGVRFVGEDDFDGVEAVAAPLVFLEEPRLDKLGDGFPALLADQSQVFRVRGIGGQGRRGALLQ